MSADVAASAAVAEARIPGRASSYGYVPGGALSADAQMDMAARISLENRNLDGLAELYRQHDCMREKPEMASPAFRAVHDEFIQSWDFALDQSRQAFLRSPSADEAAVRRHEILLLSGRRADAFEFWFENCRHLERETQSRLKIAREKMCLGQFAAAADECRAVIEGTPDDGTAQAGLILALSRAGQTGQAEEAQSALSARLRDARSDHGKTLLALLTEIITDGSDQLPDAFTGAVFEACESYCRSDGNDVGLVRGLWIIARERSSDSDRKLALTLTHQRDAGHHDVPQSDIVRNRAVSLIYGRLLRIPAELEPEWREDRTVAGRTHAVLMTAYFDRFLIYDALREAGSALEYYVVSDIPRAYTIAGDYKIMKHETLFYALPRDVSDFVIFRGRVFRLPPVFYQMRALASPRTVAFARRVQNLLIDSANIEASTVPRSRPVRAVMGVLYVGFRIMRRLGRTMPGRAVKRLAAKLARGVLKMAAQKGVIVSRDLEKLVKEIHAR